VSEDSDCSADHVTLHAVEETGGGCTVLHWGFTRAHDHGMNYLVVLFTEGRLGTWPRDKDRDSLGRLTYGDGRFTLAMKIG
jgi:hypothetical protein